MKQLFRNRVFLIVASVDLIQQLGIWVRNMALLFYVMDQTGNDPVAVSLLTVFEYLPIFVFSMIGGTLADRWNPKRTMIAGDALSALSIAVILAFIEAGWWQAVFAATIVSAVVSQFSQPSSSIMFKRHVPEELVPAAIGVTQSLMSLFVIVGPMIGTAVYVWLGVSTSLLILVIAFAAAALIQLALPAYVREKRPDNSSVWSEMAMGLRYVGGQRNLLLITAAFALIGLGSGLIQPLDVFLITERLGLDKEDLKWFYALSGIGMLVGGGAAAVFGRKANPRIVVASAIVFLSASIVVEALSVWVGLTATMRFLVGGALTFMQIILGTALISMVAEAYIGRVNGTIVPVMMAGMLIGSGLSGFLMKSTGLVPAYIIAAAIVLLAAPVAMRMKIDRPKDAEPSLPIAQGETADAAL
ncbi:MFS transporter [Paenibacillus methanolicus]|uniref:Putative MFS family arabinose efflux permease n=1 Tax=Paenibacillus methanolicus TaxID=582686 RepID=A0A5S5C4M3_9BACL|nr:MFS transporter [Paenibacillus methanolicus]TYP73366.1 putative MFS family arabinose efflux permease [Paenibacillus methanolicus]